MTNLNPGTTTVPANTLVGQPFARPAVWHSAASSLSGNTLTVTGAGWSGGQFTTAPHYLTLLDGSFAGSAYEVVSHTADTLTLDGNVAASLSAGGHFEIRQHATLSSLLGAVPTTLAGAATIGSADEVQAFNSSTQTVARYYYKTSGLGGIGWRSSASTSINRATTIIDPEQGLAFVNKSGSGHSWLVSGDARTGTYAALVPQGISWFTITQPVAVTLTQLGLYTGSNTTGFAEATTIASADEVQRWTGTAWERFYYKSSGVGGTGWRSSASSSLDRSDQLFQPGEVIVVQRKAAPDFIYFRPVAP